MAMIKGLYVAGIKLNFAIDENEKGILHYEKIHERVTQELTPMLESLIKNETDNAVEVTVTQMFADVWRAEDDQN